MVAVLDPGISWEVWSRVGSLIFWIGFLGRLSGRVSSEVSSDVQLGGVYG